MIDLQAASNKAILAAISARLRQLRIQANLTQEELAQKTGLSLSTLKRIEKGANTTLSQLIRILRSLNRLDELANLVQQENPSPIELASRSSAAQSARLRVRKRQTEQSQDNSFASFKVAEKTPPFQVVKRDE